MGPTVGVHVVFTDLVAPTPQSGPISPARAELVRRAHLGVLRAAMAPHGGREVKSLGNGLMVMFPSLGAALDASIAMQQAVTDHQPGAGRVRIGLSSGDAVEADGDISGPPIAEAARLCAKAGPGQIVLTELIARMARKSGHSFRGIGTLDLREEADPVPAMVVRWEPFTTSPPTD